MEIILGPDFKEPVSYAKVPEVCTCFTDGETEAQRNVICMVQFKNLVMSFNKSISD